MFKKAFTLVEMLVVLVILSVGILWAVEVIKYGLNFVDKTRKKIIAINLAREGVEAVYNIRDTNFKRWAGVKDQCWLKTDPLLDEWWDWCQNDPWIQPGNRVVMQKISGDNQYWILTGQISNALDLKDWIDSSDRHFALCLSNSWWQACPDMSDNPTPEGRFFREVEVKGLWDKRNDVPLVCSNGTEPTEDPNCWNSTPKELIFCVNVAYMGMANGREKICTSLTNFEK